MTAATLKAPFPYFGGKRDVAALVWQRFGTGAKQVRQYIEPFCGSAAVLLGAPEPASLEVVNDVNEGDYPKLDAAGYVCVPWTRKRLTYSGSETTDKEAIWFSPACPVPRVVAQQSLFG